MTADYLTNYDMFKQKLASYADPQALEIALGGGEYMGERYGDYYGEGYREEGIADEVMKHEDETFLQIMLDALPEDRRGPFLLKARVNEDEMYFHHWGILRNPKKLQIALNAIPKDERPAAILKYNSWGNSLDETARDFPKSLQILLQEIPTDEQSDALLSAYRNAPSVLEKALRNFDSFKFVLPLIEKDRLPAALLETKIIGVLLSAPPEDNRKFLEIVADTLDQEGAKTLVRLAQTSDPRLALKIVATFEEFYPPATSLEDRFAAALTRRAAAHQTGSALNAPAAALVAASSVQPKTPALVEPIGQ